MHGAGGDGKGTVTGGFLRTLRAGCQVEKTWSYLLYQAGGGSQDLGFGFVVRR